ncbi:hypothetical protein [Sphingobacterium sp. ML3W]|nr:hypothetical protein [Sphingobacterium sp. ML3W]
MKLNYLQVNLNFWCQFFLLATFWLDRDEVNEYGSPLDSVYEKE